VGDVLAWYADHARDLPWRADERTPWGVMVSEVMLQQTQVSRVEPRWRDWMTRWPTPADLAAAPLAEVIVAWQGLGYPRRALRLHAAAAAMVQRHAGEVPSTYEALRALPGVGDYTASAVLAFAYGSAVPVLDTNVRRVLHRWLLGSAFPAAASVGRYERDLAAELLPGGGLAPVWSVAVMELGALICTARRPACPHCPLAASCRWRQAGQPPGAPPTGQARFEGSDRQARGFLLKAVAGSPGRAPAALIGEWVSVRRGDQAAAAQGERALASLLADGLLATRDGCLILPPG